MQLELLFGSFHERIYDAFISSWFLISRPNVQTKLRAKSMTYQPIIG